jgi:hypothetical protein
MGTSECFFTKHYAVTYAEINFAWIVQMGSSIRDKMILFAKSHENTIEE